MLHLSNFVKLFHHQNFVLYCSVYMLKYIILISKCMIHHAMQTKPYNSSPCMDSLVHIKRMYI